MDENCKAALRKLSQREELILKMRHGLDVEAPMTLKDIGKSFGVTTERIRQIEWRAIRKLRWNG